MRRMRPLMRPLCDPSKLVGAVSSCAGCGQRINWGELCGRPHPFDFDGHCHYSTCARPKSVRRTHPNQGNLFT